MPAPRTYTRARYLLMQVIMWLVLGATLAVAGLLVHSQHVAHQVNLSPQPVVVPGATLHLPLNWRIHQTASSSGELLKADEPGRAGRSLSVYRQRLMRPLSPIEFLAAAFNIDLRSDHDPSLEDLDGAIDPTRFGEYRGIIMSTRFTVPGHGNDPARKEVYAAAALPSGHMIAIRLAGAGALNGGDFRLVDQVARSMTIQDEPSLGAAGQAMALANGIRVTPPPGFEPIANSDPDLTRRRLWYSPVPGQAHPNVRWASIELIPCILPARGPADAPGISTQKQVLTMLMARDPGWRGATVRSRGPREFSADMPIDQSAIIFPTRAFLLVDPSGEALLAIIRNSGTDLDACWKQLRQSISFPGQDVDAMVRAGAREVRRLHQLPLDQLLAQRKEQWFLWGHIEDHPRLGWSHIKWSPDEILADAERHFRVSDQRVTRINEAFSASADWNRFDSNTTWTEVSRDEPGYRLVQQVKLRGDELSLSATSPTGTLAHWSRKAPENYIASALLPHLIPSLSSTPMVLQTDAFIRQELDAPACPPACPLMLIVRTAPPSATGAPTHAPRTVMIQINGTGERSRWHIAPDGNVQSVDFAGGIERQPSTERQIKLQFAGNPAMQ